MGRVRPAVAAKPPRTFPIVLAGFTAFVDLYATQPLLPLLARTFHASTFAVSLTITASTVAVALAAPIVGRLGDRVGARRVIVGAASGLALSTALAATSSGLPQLIAWRFVQGLFTPGVFAVTIAYIHEQWPRARVGTVTAAYVSGTVIGGFAGRLIAGILAADVSWRAAFVGLGVVNVAAAVALWIWLPAGGDRRENPSSSMTSSIRVHLRNPQLVATYAVGFCVLFSLVALFTYVTFYLAAPPFELTTGQLGSLFTVYLVGAAITPMSGKWIDRYGHRAGLGLATVFGVIGAALTLGHAIAFVVAGLSLAASGVFIAQAAATSHVGATAGEGRGVAIGLYSMFYYVGGSAGGAVPALLWNAAGWRGCVALVIGVQLATVALALAFWAEPGVSVAPRRLEA
jgi:YNFM family putative membrane transporter